MRNMPAVYHGVAVRNIILALGCLAIGLMTLASASAAEPLKIVEAWVTPALAKGRPMAAYVVIDNPTDQPDSLQSIDVGSEGSAALHQSSAEGGVMRMRPVDSLTIPAHGRLTMKPGDVHIMVTGLTRALHPGDTLPMTLHFAKAGDLRVDFTARGP